jgi:hypothetical protein
MECINKIFNGDSCELLSKIDDNSIDCTLGVKGITNLSVDLQTASMVIKSIQDSDLMD